MGCHAMQLDHTYTAGVQRPFVPHIVELGPAGAAQPPTAVLVHGILGSARNWLGFSRRLRHLLPGWRLVLVDLRNHGESHGAPAPHTVDACAGDLVALGLRVTAIVGHSYGGKVAAAFAARRPPALRVACVLDTPPSVGRQVGASGEVAAVMGALERIPVPAPSRRAVSDALFAAGLGPAIGAWMTTNLRRLVGGGGYVWRFDLEAVAEMLDDYHRWPLWPLLDDAEVPVHVVRAGRGGRWTEADVARLEAHRGVTCHVMPQAGHWLHADDPVGLARLLAATLEPFGPE